MKPSFLTLALAAFLALVVVGRSIPRYNTVTDDASIARYNGTLDLLKRQWGCDPMPCHDGHTHCCFGTCDACVDGNDIDPPTLALHADATPAAASNENSRLLARQWGCDPMPCHDGHTHCCYGSCDACVDGYEVDPPALYDNDANVNVAAENEDKPEPPALYDADAVIEKKDEDEDEDEKALRILERQWRCMPQKCPNGGVHCCYDTECRMCVDGSDILEGNGTTGPPPAQ